MIESTSLSASETFAQCPECLMSGADLTLGLFLAAGGLGASRQV